jgi:hypothetical protein
VAARKSQAVAEKQEDMARLSETGLEARTIDDAIAMLSLAQSGSESLPHASLVAPIAAGGGGGLAAAVAAEEESHPEKRMKAAWNRYKDKELPNIKAEYPSLRLSQHMDMLKRKWDKSPENPLVMAARVEAAAASSWKEK